MNLHLRDLHLIEQRYKSTLSFNTCRTMFKWYNWALDEKWMNSWRRKKSIHIRKKVNVWESDWLHVIHLWWRIWSSIYTQFDFYHAWDLLTKVNFFLFFWYRGKNVNSNRKIIENTPKWEIVKTKTKTHFDLVEVIVNRRPQFKLIAIKSGTDSNLLSVTSYAAGLL